MRRAHAGLALFAALVPCLCSAAELAHHIKNMRLVLEEQAFAHQKAIASAKRARRKEG